VSDRGPRCGRIAYTNDLPVYAAIDEGAVIFPGDMMAGVPAELNVALLNGDLDISPISSAFYAAYPDRFVLVPGICIGAAGPVHSIVCVSDVALEQLAGRTIATTRESATGRMLFRLICRRLGFDPVLVESDDPLSRYQADATPCLLIGDKAIDAAQQAPMAAVHDLGERWFAMTGLGMVYAVWAAREDYAIAEPERVHAIADSLRMSLRWGLENMSRVIERAQTVLHRPAGFYETYYRALRFELDGDARAALTCFFEAAHAQGMIAAVPSLRFFEKAPLHV
jgi:chorismate dehydratase